WLLDPILRAVYPDAIVRDIREVAPEAVLECQQAARREGLDAVSAPPEALASNYYHGALLSGHPQPTEGNPHETEGQQRGTASPCPSHEGIHWVERGLPRTGMGWEVQPDGLTRLLVRLHEEYAPEVPLYVTE